MPTGRRVELTARRDAEAAETQVWLDFSLECEYFATIFLTAATNCGHFNLNSDGKTIPDGKTILALTHVIVAHQLGKHLGFPGIILLKNGSLMVVFREATRHEVDKEGKISFVRSCDGDKIWSAPKILYDTPDADDRDPAVGFL